MRVREFTMAEIEHYVDPLDKRHERFKEVRDIVLTLLDRQVQSAGGSEVKKISIGEAVNGQRPVKTDRQTVKASSDGLLGRPLKSGSVIYR